MIKNYLKKNPQLYSIIRYIYTPIRNLKIRKKVNYYSKKGIEKLKNIESQKVIFYFGQPIHKNLGDLAQFFCISKWLKDTYKEYEIVAFETYATYSKKFIKLLNKKFNNESIIVFQSGYCTKEDHLDHKMHRIIVNRFKNNMVIFFPQTVNFFNPKELKKTSNIYNKHNNLIFLARDNISYETAKNNFKTAKVLLYPDIVTSLIGNFKFKECKNKKGLLLCLRNDGEKLFSNKLYESKELLKKCEIIDKCDTFSPYSYDETLSNLENTIREFIEKISEYEIVITDRYHGTIFSIISNTYVVVVPTNDHKVKTGALWFDGIYDTVCLVRNPEEGVKRALNYKTRKIENRDYFKQTYYDKLCEELKHGNNRKS